MNDFEKDLKKALAGDDVLTRFARAIVRVMREEHLECTRETAYELMADLFEHSKGSKYGHMIPEGETFATAFDHDARETFWAKVQAMHEEATR